MDKLSDTEQRNVIWRPHDTTADEMEKLTEFLTTHTAVKDFLENLRECASQMGLDESVNMPHMEASADGGFVIGVRLSANKFVTFDLVPTQTYVETSLARQ